MICDLVLRCGIARCLSSIIIIVAKQTRIPPGQRGERGQNWGRELERPLYHCAEDLLHYLSSFIFSKLITFSTQKFLESESYMITLLVSFGFPLVKALIGSIDSTFLPLIFDCLISIRFFLFNSGLSLIYQLL